MYARMKILSDATGSRIISHSDLSSNEITSIASEAFSGLGKLTKLFANAE
jgi:hypothetical protein